MSRRFISPETMAEAENLLRQGLTPRQVAQQIGICKATIYNHFRGSILLPKRDHPSRLKNGPQDVKRCLVCRYLVNANEPCRICANRLLRAIRRNQNP